MTLNIRSFLLCGITSLALAACDNQAPSAETVNTASEQAQEPVWDGNKVILESKKLADGIFAVIPTGAADMAAKGKPIATTSGFVIGDNGVLVIDSMLNKRLHDQLIALIAKETSKPVTHMVNTSYHGDHSYGNFYLPESVDIIQHQKTADYIASKFEADTQFMKQNFGEGRGIEDIKPVSADTLIQDGKGLEIDLGGKRVVIQDFGFAQTGGDLFVTVPEADILWTGNPVIADAPALPWLLDGHMLETLATMEKVYASTNENSVIIPGHGPVTDRKAIKLSIDYLTALKNEVQQAVDAGLTLEETVEKIQMPKYEGYALRGWVHFELNIPAAYKDLKGR